MDNQEKAVLEYMREHGGITALEAVNELGVMRLASVIFNLKSLGFKIESEWQVSRNRYGTKSNYKIYKEVK